MAEHFEGSYKDQLMKKASWLLLALTIFVVAEILIDFKEYVYVGMDVVPQAVISVEGEGEVTTTPDIAKFSFSVMNSAKTVKEAQDATASVMNEALAYLRKAGVATKDLKTESYYVNPKYEYSYTAQPGCEVGMPCPYFPPKQNLVGYDVSQSVEVKIRDLDKAGELLSGVGKFKVYNLSNLQFTLDDEDKPMEEARDLAIEDAKLQAKKLAKSLGVKLVRIIGVQDSVSYPDLYGRGGGMETMAVSKADITPDLPIGENKATSMVTVLYEIR